jgi:hypothetical protein
LGLVKDYIVVVVVVVEVATDRNMVKCLINGFLSSECLMND